jgi:hypothetical protein
MVASARDRAKATSMAPLYHLEVVLNHVEPHVRRRLQVPGNANLGWLHAVIQVAFGWTNSHLHQFRDGERIFTDPAFEQDKYEDSPPTLDERKVTLMQVVPQVVLPQHHEMVQALNLDRLRPAFGDPLGKLCAEDFVLGLQVLDVPSQLRFAQAGEHQDERMEKPSHRCLHSVP